MKPGNMNAMIRPKFNPKLSFTGSSLSVARALGPILRLRIAHGLPLHVARVVCPALAKRDYVVHDVSLPPLRVARHSLELPLFFRAPLDPAAAVARDARCVAASVVRWSGIVTGRMVARGRASV